MSKAWKVVVGAVGVQNCRPGRCWCLSEAGAAAVWCRAICKLHLGEHCCLVFACFHGGYRQWFPCKLESMQFGNSMSNTSHILGLHENDLFYGMIQMALVLVRMVITGSLPVESTSPQAKMGRSLRSCT